MAYCSQLGLAADRSGIPLWDVRTRAQESRLIVWLEEEPTPLGGPSPFFAVVGKNWGLQHRMTPFAFPAIEVGS